MYMHRAKTPINRQTGVTLLELMITVAIIGILAALIYPNYTASIVKSTRSEGMIALQNAAARQERFFSNNNAYSANTADVGFPAGMTENNNYRITIAACAAGTLATCYVLTATAQAGQLRDTPAGAGAPTDCTVLTLDSAGRKAPAACW